MSSLGQNRHQGMLINRVMLNRGGRDSIYRSGLGVFSRRRDLAAGRVGFHQLQYQSHYREALSQDSDVFHLCSGVCLH